MSALQVLERIRDEVNAFISGMTEKAEKTEALTAEAVETEKTEALTAEVVENAVVEVAATATGTGQTKSRKTGGVNKSELIRNYFEKHGMGSRNKDLIYAIRKSKDVELNPTLVSIIRKNIESKRVSKTRAQKMAVVGVAAEAPAATGTVLSNGQTKSRKTGGVNKSELIRNYFEKHGMGSRNKDLIYAIRKSKGVELNPTLVSIIRNNIESKRVSKTRVQKVLKVKKAGKARAVTGSNLAGLPMTALCARILQKIRGSEGLKLAEIADLVIQSGYKYAGSKGREGVVQNVYQALHNLSKKTAHPGYEGQVAVILKDETSHRYRLNPRAKFKNVA